MSYKLYSIIPSASMGETIGIVTEMMKTPFSKYPKNLSLKQEKRADKYYPSRIITSSFATSSFTGFGLYKLTDAEADEIKKDPLISNVLPINTQSYAEDPGIIETGSVYIDTSSLLSAIPDRNFRIYPWPRYTQGIDTATLSNVAPNYHSLSLNKMYSGSYGKETSRALGLNPDSNKKYESSDTFQPQGLQAFTNNHDYNYSVDGKNVDFIHWESFIPQEWNHAEYYGLDGNSRVKFVNWNSYNGPNDNNTEGSNWFPQGNSNRSIYRTTINEGPQHPQKCIMSAVGLTSGFAKGANIHYIASALTYDALIKTLNTIKLWDATKPINPKTGKRNRTVLNTSFFLWSARFPPYSQTTNSPQRVSGSIEFPASFVEGYGGTKPAIRFEGQKISDDTRRDYVFSWGPHSGTATLLSRKINKGYYLTANVYLTSSYWGAGVANNINQHLNPTSTSSGWNVSIDGNFLHFTSSDGTYIQPIDAATTQSYSSFNPLRIYSGSSTDFYHINTSASYYNASSPRGGALVFEESAATSPKTHISKIVVKGNLVYTGSTDPSGSNGYLNSNHNLSTNPPVDDYGIDRGINPLYEDLQISQPGITRGIGSEYTPTLALALKECAEQGIVITQAAGNTQVQMTMASSSLEDNPLFDHDLYSDELWNTYVEYDIEYAGWSQGQEDSDYFSLPEGPIPPNTPIRLGNPFWANNHSVIQVGSLDLTEYNNMYYSPETQKTMSGSVYGGDFPNNLTKDRIFPQTRKCYGKAISSYAISPSMVIGGTSPTNTLTSADSYYGFIAHTSSFYNNITFNTSSIISAGPFLIPGSTTGSYGIPIFTQGLYTLAPGGGTSFSAPLVAGMICCYLEVNPDASFVDVRNWLHNTGMKEVPGTLSDPNKYYHLGRYETSSVHPAYYNDLYMDSGSIDFGGRNPVIARFPYNSPMRGSLSNFSMSRS